MTLLDQPRFPDASASRADGISAPSACSRHRQGRSSVEAPPPRTVGGTPSRSLVSDSIAPSRSKLPGKKKGARRQTVADAWTENSRSSVRAQAPIVGNLPDLPHMQQRELVRSAPRASACGPRTIPTCAGWVPKVRLADARGTERRDASRLWRQTVAPGLHRSFPGFLQGRFISSRYPDSGQSGRGNNPPGDAMRSAAETTVITLDLATAMTTSAFTSMATGVTTGMRAR
jgi:hypothetical protein